MHNMPAVFRSTSSRICNIGYIQPVSAVCPSHLVGEFVANGVMLLSLWLHVSGLLQMFTIGLHYVVAQA
jgi:hypothetical protein